MAETTRRVLKNVFSVQLARQLNFAGRGEKMGIGGMNVTSVIVRKLPFYSLGSGYIFCSQ